MSTALLEPRLLGTPAIRCNGATLSLSRKKSVALLAYLAVNGKSYIRDSLATLLWPELGDQQARGNRRRLLSELRKQLGEELLPVEGERVGPLGQGAVYLDTREFEPLIGQSKAHRHGQDTVCRACLGRLRRAEEFCRGACSAVVRSMSRPSATLSAGCPRSRRPSGCIGPSGSGGSPSSRLPPPPPARRGRFAMMP
jgi:hypothetical protein